MSKTILKSIQRGCVGAAFAMSFSFAVSASASPINDFNLIAFGNVVGNSEVEGRTAIFGDVDFGTKNFVVDAAGLSDPVDTAGLNVPDGLIVGGSINDGPINVNNSANTRVGGSGNAAFVNSNGGTATFNDGGVAGILSSISADVLATEAFLGSQIANSTIDLSDQNRAVFNSTPVNGISVFQASSIDLFLRNGQFDITGDLTADVFLIQVTGSDDISTGGLNPNSFEFGQDEFRERIVFFFEDADNSTDLEFNGGLGGSIFARQANLNITNAHDGLVVANNVILNGEVHLPLTGIVIPEPSSAALIGLGLTILARRRRA